MDFDLHYDDDGDKIEDLMSFVGFLLMQFG